MGFYKVLDQLLFTFFSELNPQDLINRKILKFATKIQLAEYQRISNSSPSDHSSQDFFRN